MSRIVRGCAIVLIAMSTVAALSGSGARAQGQPVLKIGVPLAATGADAREGALTLEGYELWADRVNAGGGLQAGGTAYTVQLVNYNDESNPEQSAKLTERLITQDHVNFLFGPYASGVTLADAAVANRFKIPMVAPAGAARKIFQQGYTYIFAVLSPANEYAATMLKTAGTLTPKPQTVAILSAGDLFSAEVAGGAKDWAGRNGLKVVFFEQYPVGLPDLTAALRRIGALHPDILLGTGHLQESLLTVKQAQALDVNVPFIGFTVGPATPDFVRILGPAANLVFSSAQWSPDVRYQGRVLGSAREYAAAFRRKYGFVPGYTSASASAAGLALQTAIGAAGTVDPQRVRDALARLDVMTFYGRIKFNAEGLNVSKPMVTIQIQHGAPVTVWPPDVAAAKPVYPMPSWASRR